MIDLVWPTSGAWKSWRKTGKQVDLKWITWMWLGI